MKLLPSSGQKLLPTPTRLNDIHRIIKINLPPNLSAIGDLSRNSPVCPLMLSEILFRCKIKFTRIPRANTRLIGSFTFETRTRNSTLETREFSVSRRHIYTGRNWVKRSLSIIIVQRALLSVLSDLPRGITPVVGVSRVLSARLKIEITEGGNA